MISDKRKNENVSFYNDFKEYFNAIDISDFLEAKTDKIEIKFGQSYKLILKAFDK